MNRRRGHDDDDVYGKFEVIIWDCYVSNAHWTIG
jgi:hypothetical protein